MTVVSASKQPLPESEQKLTAKSVGSFLDMKVRVPARMRAFEEILTVDESEHRLNWGTRDFPSWALRTERRQALKRITSDSGKERTRYECLALFSGPLAYVVKLVLRSKLQASFEATAKALKERAEKESSTVRGTTS